MLLSGSMQPPSPHGVSFSWLNWHSPPTAIALARNQGIKRIASKRRSPKPHLPIAPSILRRVQVYLFSQPCTWSQRMIWAAMNICFFGFLRLGEICTSSASVFDQTTHLAPSDVSLDNLTSPFKMFVTIKASKTDPFRSGVTLVLGATNQDLCPVGATLPYLSIRGTGDGPLFKFEDGSFLYRDQFVAEVRKLLRSAGIEACQYSGHSFRIGVATTAALAGISSRLAAQS